MDGVKADCVFTDPPYNVAIGSKNAVLNEMNHAKRGHRVETEIAGDKGLTDAEIGEQLWKPAFQNMADHAKDDCSIYVTMPQGGTHMMMMMMMMADACWQVKHELMWLKNQPTFSMGRLDYDYKHEPIMYGWKKTHNFYGKGKFTKSVWEIDKPRESKLHPTMKPIELIANALENSTKENDCVLDVFGGSGSTLIACEQLNRKCYMCELDPKYCDVIIQRYENFTGQKAVKINE
jgi:DNA modification methylase